MGFERDATMIEEVAQTRDPSFRLVAKGALSDAMTTMRAKASGTDRDAFLLAAMQVMALGKNAHSRVIPNAAVSVLPVRVVLHDGQICVVRDGAFCPLVAVNGTSVAQICSAWRPYLAGNPARQAVLSGLMLAWPAALCVAGVSGPDYTFALASGQSIRLTSEDRAAARRWFSENETGALRSQSDPYPAPPVARDGAIWRVRLGDLKTLTPPEADAIARTLRADPAGVVIDLRGNPGGSFLTALPVVDAVTALDPGQRCAVLANAYTFSAAIVVAALIVAHVGPRAAVFGADMGDDLSFWAEGDLLDLPQSGARLRYSTAWHDWRSGRADDTTPPDIAQHLVAAGDLHVRQVSEAEQVAAARAFVLSS